MLVTCIDLHGCGAETFTMLDAVKIKVINNYPFLKVFLIKTLLFLLSEIKMNWGGKAKKGCSSDTVSNRKMQITQK